MPRLHYWRISKDALRLLAQETIWGILYSDEQPLDELLNEDEIFVIRKNGAAFSSGSNAWLVNTDLRLENIKDDDITWWSCFWKKAERQNHLEVFTHEWALYGNEFQKVFDRFEQIAKRSSELGYENKCFLQEGEKRMPAKMKRIINCIMPVTACNFKCHYCYIGQTVGFKGEIKELPKSLEFIAHALRPERIGEGCHLSLCGSGETLLAPYIVELVKRFTDMGHYCAIITNGTLSNRIDELCALPPENQRHIFVKFSFHYLELIKRNLLEQFWKNVHKIRNTECSFTIELTVNDESIPYIPAIQQNCMENAGAQCHLVESRDNRSTDFRRLTQLPEKEHKAAWEQLSSPLFNFQQTTWGKKRREFCYAGDWVTNFYLETGDVYTCFADGQKIGNLYEDVENPFPFVAVGENCPWAHCFPSYVLLTSGAIPSFSAPTYAEMRNRTCADGSTWLKPSIQSFFGSRFCEANQEYSPDKKLYINALMAVEHHNTEAQTDFSQLGKIVKESLHKRGIYKVAVYGGGEKADFICKALNAAEMPPLFCIDSAYTDQTPPSVKERIKRKLRYTVRNSRRTSPSDPVYLTFYDSWPKVDAIIVPEHADFYNCKSHISQIINSKVLSLIELVE